MQDSNLEKYFNKADLNKDNLITFEEFAAMLGVYCKNITVGIGSLGKMAYKGLSHLNDHVTEFTNNAINAVLNNSVVDSAKQT